ncbi:MAG: DUF4388 domain-containing protein [Cyanobacteria bacterium NC_groundwater_1444_Ag_S-0.65um_54_12]|nr:DUF4388 domain-containing protein [Cyanobacteria bacterium NC_groundwater_1444_Ag_S-0.65um_54_12]
MSKLILSGDLNFFRIEMLVRILEAIKLNAEVTIDGQEKGQLYFQQGKVVGANTATDQGMVALGQIVQWKSGTFSVRLTDEAHRHVDLVKFADNQAIFRHLLGQANPKSAVPGQPQSKTATAAPSPSPAGTTGSATGRSPAMPRSGPRAMGPSVGPLAQVPEVTDKGRIALRGIQTNYALRGVQVEAESWRVLGKIDGSSTLYQIGEMVGILGERLLQIVKDLQQEGYLRFATNDPSTEYLKQSKFRLGEYLVAKGTITEVQLEAALRRQSELARKGRYLWLGEILVEMNYVRPSQVQEAMAIQKRNQGN